MGISGRALNVHIRCGMSVLRARRAVLAADAGPDAEGGQAGGEGSGPGQAEGQAPPQGRDELPQTSKLCRKPIAQKYVAKIVALCVDSPGAGVLQPEAALAGVGPRHVVDASQVSNGPEGLACSPHSASMRSCRRMACSRRSDTRMPGPRGAPPRECMIQLLRDTIIGCCVPHADRWHPREQGHATLGVPVIPSVTSRRQEREDLPWPLEYLPP